MNVGLGECSSVHNRENDTLSRRAVSAAVLKDKVGKNIPLQELRYKNNSEHDLAMEF